MYFAIFGTHYETGKRSQVATMWASDAADAITRFTNGFCPCPYDDIEADQI